MDRKSIAVVILSVIAGVLFTRWGFDNWLKIEPVRINDTSDPAHRQAALIWEDKYQQAKRDLASDFQCIKKKGHNKYKKGDCSSNFFDEAQWLYHNLPYPVFDDFDRSIRALDIGTCGYVESEAIYYFGMNIGEDPTPDFNSCMLYGKVIQ